MTRSLLPSEVTWVEGIPVTTPARTVIDLADVVTLRRTGGRSAGAVVHGAPGVHPLDVP